MKTVFLSPEPPYPLHGGGAYRVASLLHFFAALGPVDFILISHTGQPALLPPGLVRTQHVVTLKRNRRTPIARILRNAVRAVKGIPPLTDRMAGLEDQIRHALGPEHYDLGVIEHSWCARYIEQLHPACHQTILDLHNIESILHSRSARFAPLPVRAGHLRFAITARKHEALLLPRFSHVLATSQTDADAARQIAPSANLAVYPNSFPLLDLPCLTEENLVVFSANFEYHPNIDAIRWLMNDIWPAIRRNFPSHRLSLVGRGDENVRHLLSQDVHCTGPLENTFNSIAAASVVIAPLRSGSGTRLKIIEAWAAARPVVATSIAAEGLDALPNQNILIADTPVDFSAALTLLLTNPAERKRLGDAGRKTFEHSYTWNAAWAQLNSVLQPAPLVRTCWIY